MIKVVEAVLAEEGGETSSGDVNEDEGSQDGSSEALDLQIQGRMRGLGKSELIASPVEVSTSNHVRNGTKGDTNFDDGILIDFTEVVERLVVNDRSKSTHDSGDEVHSKEEAKTKSSEAYKVNRQFREEVKAPLG